MYSVFCFFILFLFMFYKKSSHQKQKNTDRNNILLRMKYLIRYTDLRKYSPYFKKKEVYSILNVSIIILPFKFKYVQDKQTSGS